MKDFKRFAKRIEGEVQGKVGPWPSSKRASQNFTKQLVIMLAGVIGLLAVCIVAFDGTMIPAMWQLSSVIWIYYRIKKWNF